MVTGDAALWETRRTKGKGKVEVGGGLQASNGDGTVAAMEKITGDGDGSSDRSSS